MADLAKNLQLLSSRSRSVSELCRELKINRQQFARYMSGEGMPSPYNLRKIADHFQLSATELSLEHKEFLKALELASLASRPVHSSPVAEFLNTSAEDHAKREAYAGYYSAFLQSPTEPTKLLKSLVHLHINGERLLSRWDESFTRAKDGSFQVSRYEGIVRFLGDHAFIVDVETSTREVVLETILRVPYRRRTKLLTGITLGMTTGQQRIPFASIAVFRSLGKRIDEAAQRKQCGFFELNSKSVDPIVRDAFTSQVTSHLYPKTLERI
jgi:transcriptional regulator with XRE-family HTH domain